MAAEMSMVATSSRSIAISSGCNTSGDCLPSLPEEVCLQILSDLPVKSLVRFKLVCKSWLSIIQSLDFVNQHRRKHGCIKDNNEDIDDENLLVFYHEVDSSHLPAPPQLSLITPHSEHSLDLDVTKLFPDCHRCLPPHSMLSFDGITCLTFLHRKPRSRSFTIYLWNPTTEETWRLPRIPLPISPKGDVVRSIHIGFGFDFKTYDYKVIRIAHHIYSSPVFSQVDIYSFNTHSWRTITDSSSFPPTRYVSSSNIKQPLQDGRIFCWLATKTRYVMDEPSGVVQTILSFDFSSEEFGTVPFPNAIAYNHYKNLSVTGGDKITCLNYLEDDSFEVWILNEFGVKDSWTKLLHFLPFLPEVDQSNVVSILNNRVSFLVVLNNHLCIYNKVTGETRKLSLQKELSIEVDSIIRYKESLVSIKIDN